MVGQRAERRREGECSRIRTAAGYWLWASGCRCLVTPARAVIINHYRCCWFCSKKQNLSTIAVVRIRRRLEAVEVTMHHTVELGH